MGPLGFQVFGKDQHLPSGKIEIPADFAIGDPEHFPFRHLLWNSALPGQVLISLFCLCNKL